MMTLPLVYRVNVSIEKPRRRGEQYRLTVGRRESYSDCRSMREAVSETIDMVCAWAHCAGEEFGISDQCKAHDSLAAQLRGRSRVDIVVDVPRGASDPETAGTRAFAAAVGMVTK